MKKSDFVAEVSSAQETHVEFPRHVHHARIEFLYVVVRHACRYAYGHQKVEGQGTHGKYVGDIDIERLLPYGSRVHEGELKMYVLDHGILHKHILTMGHLHNGTIVADAPDRLFALFCESFEASYKLIFRDFHDRLR